MKKVLSILLIVFSAHFVYETLFGYEYVTEEVKWHKNEYLWNVADKHTGPHEDVREVLSRIEEDNPNAKPGDTLKIRVKVRR